MTISDLIEALEERGPDDAASSEEIGAVRSVLLRAAEHQPTSDAYRIHVTEAARLVSDSWPFRSGLGALVLSFSEATRRNAR